MKNLLRPIALALSVTFASLANAQPRSPNPFPPIRSCPGAFPTDLSHTANCEYTSRQRALDFVSGTVTDQAVMGAAVFGLGAQIIQSPNEWKRTWYGYGMRVGSTSFSLEFQLLFDNRAPNERLSDEKELSTWRKLLRASEVGISITSGQSGKWRNCCTGGQFCMIYCGLHEKAAPTGGQSPNEKLYFVELIV